jgi:chromosome partitioning protein
MPVIAIVNPKGGSGKSTLATHLAGHAASLGLPVMLGDVDRQKSSAMWLRRRAAQPMARGAPIQSWVTEPQNLLRAPPGVTHAVLDTPGGLRDFELARVAMAADAVLVPVCDSVFDRDAAAQAWLDLKVHPRVASGRCKVAIVGMRVDARTHAEATLRGWAEQLGAPFVGVLRNTTGYVRCIEVGLTIFDLPEGRGLTDRAQWQPILAWLDPLWTSREAAAPSLAADASRADAEEDGPAPTRVKVTPARGAITVNAELACALSPPSAPAAGWVKRLFGNNAWSGRAV